MGWQDLYMPPQPGLVQRGIDDLDPRTSLNDRQSLSKVTNKHDSDASKQWDIFDILTLYLEVSESTIHCFCTIMMLHGCFIPYNEFCTFEDSMQVVILFDTAGRAPSVPIPDTNTENMKTLCCLRRASGRLLHCI